MIESLSVKEFAKRKSVSEETVRRWCRNGKFNGDAVKLSNKEGWRIMYDFHNGSIIFNELNKNGYTLKSAILENKGIRNGANVYDALHNSGIDNWKDAVNLYRNGYLPNHAIKGIGDTTWPILIEMIAEEELHHFPYGRRALELAIDKVCPENFVSARNTKAKIQPALRHIGIYTLEQLWGAPEYYIRDNRNIGPIMWVSISKIINSEVGSHFEHYERFLSAFDEFNRITAQQIELAARWKREDNEKRNA